MHKLERPPAEPVALREARDSGCPDWDHFPSDKKAEVQVELILMQNGRCAYCEATVDQGEGHIEHFRLKNQEWFPEKTFEWKNLYYSCMRNGTCGCHKDRVLQKEEADCLIDPCVDNPEDFLQFTHNGGVEARSDLSMKDALRAKVTINTFNLKQEDLIAERANVLRGYEWLEQYPATQIDEVLAEVAATEGTPFVTAIYHYFGRRLVG